MLLLILPSHGGQKAELTWMAVSYTEGLLFTATHPSRSQVQCQLTMPIEASALPLHYTVVILFDADEDEDDYYYYCYCYYYCCDAVCGRVTVQASHIACLRLRGLVLTGGKGYSVRRARGRRLLSTETTLTGDTTLLYVSTSSIS